MIARNDDLDDKASGRDLWTIDGTNSLIRKLQHDPGLTEDAKYQFIESVRNSAVEKKIGNSESFLTYNPPRGVTIEFMKKNSDENKPVKKSLVSRLQKKRSPKTVVEKSQDKNAFDDYQDFTSTTAVFPVEVGVPYAVLGLNGEASEVAEKLGNSLTKTILSSDGLAGDQTRETLYELSKVLRNLTKSGSEAEKLKKELRKGVKVLPTIPPLSDDEKNDLADELGDQLWYCAQLAKFLGFKLSELAERNKNKLLSRQARGVLIGNGDKR